MCTSPRRYPAAVPHLFISLSEERGCAHPPTTLFLGKEGIVPRKVDKDGSCSRSWCRWTCRQSTSCDHILLSWNVASWSSFSEMSQLIRLIAALRPRCLTWATCVFHHPEKTPKPVFPTSSTELFLQSCDSKEPKRLTEAGS